MSPIDRRRVAQNFGRAAARYDQLSQLQREAREELLDRLTPLQLKPDRILDIGAGTGHGARELKRRFPRAEVVAIDLALPMLEQARRQQGWFRPFRRVVADAAALPLADASVDLIFSNLCVQWCPDLRQTFAEWGRVLRPGALALFSSFGLDSLHQLRQSWAAVDAHPHLIDFLHIQQIGDAALKAGLSNPVLDRDLLQRRTPDALTLMRELKQLGAGNAASERARGLTGKRALAKMQAAYEQLREPGGLPVTWEIVYGQAHGSAPSTRSREPRGTSVEQLRATLPSRKG